MQKKSGKENLNKAVKKYSFAFDKTRAWDILYFSSFELQQFISVLIANDQRSGQFQCEYFRCIVPVTVVAKTLFQFFKHLVPSADCPDTPPFPVDTRVFTQIDIADLLDAFKNVWTDGNDFVPSCAEVAQKRVVLEESGR